MEREHTELETRAIAFRNELGALINRCTVVQPGTLSFDFDEGLRKVEGGIEVIVHSFNLVQDTPELNGRFQALRLNIALLAQKYGGELVDIGEFAPQEGDMLPIVSEIEVLFRNT